MLQHAVQSTTPEEFAAVLWHVLEGADRGAVFAQFDLLQHAPEDAKESDLGGALLKEVAANPRQSARSAPDWLGKNAAAGS